MVTIFLPGMLLLGAIYTQRSWLRHKSWASKAIAGTGAGVVGLIAAALVSMFSSGELINAMAILMYIVAVVVQYFKALPNWMLVIVLSTIGVFVF